MIGGRGGRQEDKCMVLLTLLFTFLAVVCLAGPVVMCCAVGCMAHQDKEKLREAVGLYNAAAGEGRIAWLLRDKNKQPVVMSFPTVEDSKAPEHRERLFAEGSRLLASSGDDALLMTMERARRLMRSGGAAVRQDA